MLGRDAGSVCAVGGEEEQEEPKWAVATDAGGNLPCEGRQEPPLCGDHIVTKIRGEEGSE